LSDSSTEKRRRLFRVGEVADLLGISKASVYRLVDKGALKTVNLCHWVTYYSSNWHFDRCIDWLRKLILEDIDFANLKQVG
jgi:predicted DNA-binding transcriptional regulator AlpA